MFENGIIRRLVDDIPNYSGAQPVVDMRGRWRKVVDCLCEARPSFHDDRMDFRPNMKFNGGGDCVLNFEGIHGDAKEYVKCFCLDNIDSGLHITTEHVRIPRLKKLLNASIAEAEDGLFLNVNAGCIHLALMKSWPDNLVLQQKALSDMIAFLYFVRNEANLFLPVDIDALEEDRRFITDCLSGYDGSRHSVWLPNDVMTDIMTGLDGVMRDENEKPAMRMTAGMVLLDTQLGLRTAEIPALEVDCLRRVDGLDGNVYDYFVYNSMKPARGSVEAIPQATICTPLAKETYKYLLKLRKLIPGSEMNPFLYVHNEKCSDGRVYSKDHFVLEYQKLCSQRLHHLFEKPLGDVCSKKVYSTKYVPGKSHEVSYENLYIPNLYCYRVTFASTLRAQGFPVDFINAIMSHTPSSNVDSAYIVNTQPPKGCARELEDVFSVLSRYGQDKPAI